MRASLTYILTLTASCLWISCNQTSENNIKKASLPEWSQAQEYYLNNIIVAIAYIDSLSTVDSKNPAAKSFFIKLRIAFKNAEPYASYLNPEVGHMVNGPALPVFTDDTERVLAPIGLQKIEESIYEGQVSGRSYARELRLTRGLLVNLEQNIRKRELTPKRFFTAVHQQLLRIVSLGISGFDTPVSQLGLHEVMVSLKSLLEVYGLTIGPIMSKDHSDLHNKFKREINDALKFVSANTDFETFDRFTFIRDYMNPITRSWVAIRIESGLWGGSDDKPFNFDAPTFFETNTFNVEFFTPATNRNPTQFQINLGEKLFFDPNLSQNRSMACATCHIPEKAYADGRKFSRDNKGQPLGRNTPTLINAGFQRSFFWDGRSETLNDQVTAVFTNKDEFAGNSHEFSGEILRDSAYIALFKDAYGGIPVSNREVIKAISAYLTTLQGFNSKFDRNIRGETDTFSVEEKLGFNIFMGKALCATCHFIPLTNGTVPPFYTDTEKEVIGVPETNENLTLDDDKGFYSRYKEEIHRGMFKTPSVRNVSLTAPYMHNGVYISLEEVMDFYNRGGGGGLGFDLQHQTLPFDNLDLSTEEQQALVHFMNTLTDTIVDRS